MTLRTYIGIAVAVAVGVIAGILVLRAADVIGGDSAAEKAAAYQRCVDNLAPWRAPAECGDRPAGWGGGGWDDQGGW